MRRTVYLLFVIAALCPLGSQAQGIADIVSALQEADGYHGRATYEVTMPAFSEPVVYTVEMWSSEGDSIAPADYIIQWEVPTASGTSKGWSAYANGSHYRYRDQRLQEYHWQWDSIPLGAGSAARLPDYSRGVQNNAQFTEILPQFLARQLREIQRDTTYTWHFTPDSLRQGVRTPVVRALRRFQGYDAKELTLWLDPENYMPVRMEVENNPGSISEQSIRVDFTTLPSETPDFSEQGLIAWFPEEFARYRQGTFALESLKGQPVPAFSCPTTTGERYTYHRGDGFISPTLIIVLSPEVASTKATIEAVREAVAQLPTSVQVLWAFVTSNADQIEPLLGYDRVGEYRLISARALARDCGVTAFPAIILADRQGIAREIIPAFNNHLADDVIMMIGPQTPVTGASR
ncbi:MAG: hypothetical protein LIO91_04985 [Bacteroidales bacterium]|nr:hypothetical protein [Bacteroidales bacterium]